MFFLCAVCCIKQEIKFIKVNKTLRITIILNGLRLKGIKKLNLQT